MDPKPAPPNTDPSQEAVDDHASEEPEVANKTQEEYEAEIRALKLLRTETETEVKRIKDQLASAISKTRLKLRFLKYSVWALGGMFVVRLVLAFFPNEAGAISLADSVLVALGGLSFILMAITVSQILGFKERLIPDIVLTDKNDPSSILAGAANNCETLAEHHDERSRFFLVGGGVIGGVGVILYFLSLLAGSISNSKALQPEDSHVLLVSIRELTTQIDAKKREIEQPGSPIDTKGISDLLDRTNKLAEKLKSYELAEEQNSKTSFRRDVLPIVRNSIIFLFIEIVAGFFLSLSQRNDIQASYCRSHRQLYERLLAAPGIIETIKTSAGEARVTDDLIRLILTPVPAQIFTGKNDVNPSLEAVTALGDLIQKVKDAAKDSGK